MVSSKRGRYREQEKTKKGTLIGKKGQSHDSFFNVLSFFCVVSPGGSLNTRSTPHVRVKYCGKAGDFRLFSADIADPQFSQYLTFTTGSAPGGKLPN